MKLRAISARAANVADIFLCLTSECQRAVSTARQGKVCLKLCLHNRHDIDMDIAIHLNIEVRYCLSYCCEKLSVPFVVQ